MSVYTPDWQHDVCEECQFDPSSFAPEDLADQIERLGTRYQAPLSRGLPGEDLGELVRTRPQPDVWSALECACHVRDVLTVLELRTRQTLAENDPTYTVWDHEAAVDDEHYNEQDPAAVLEDLATNASAYAAALRSVPDGGWDRTGQRQDGVVFTVAGLGRFALHEGSHHLLDVGRALRVPLAAGEHDLARRWRAVALRSFPRRFRELFTGFDDDEKPDDLLHRAGADGHSALDHAAHVARALPLIGEALRKTLTSDGPVLHAGVMDEHEREWPDGYAEGLDDVQALLQTEATTLADAVERTSADDWTRSATIAGGQQVTALDLLQEAVRTGVDHLKAAERTLKEARGRP